MKEWEDRKKLKEKYKNNLGTIKYIHWLNGVIQTAKKNYNKGNKKQVRIYYKNRVDAYQSCLRMVLLNTGYDLDEVLMVPC